LGTQWTGGDVSSRYAASRERAAAPTASEGAVSLPLQKSISNSTARNGNAKVNGVNGRRAAKVREQVGADVVRDGVEGVMKEDRETGERRRNKG
jgi:sphinganine C4-monooxygenase